MSQRAVWVVVGGIAVLAGAWLLAGGKWPFGGGEDRGPAGGAPGETRHVEEDAPDVAPTPDAEKSSPRLFGRAREERIGKGSVVARVMDFRTGQPVSGAKALLAGTGYGLEAVSSRVLTSADGSLGFSEVPAGEAYSLRIEAEGHPSIAGPVVAVVEGRTTDLGVLWLGRRGVLEGVVVDAEGKPVADASVGLHAAMPNLVEMLQDMMNLLSRLDQEQPPLALATTDRAGRFRLEDVAPGPLMLQVRAAGFALASAKVSMTSTGAAEGEVRIVLQRGQVVGGRVVTTSGTGVPSARVAILAENDPEAWVLGRTFTETDPNGAFRIDTLPSGDRYQAIVSAAGYPTTFGHVEPGKEDNQIVLHEILRLTVRILSKEDDAPVEGATVAVAIGSSAQLSQQPDTLLFGTTDRSGRAAIDGRAGHLQMAIVSHPQRPTGMWMGALGRSIPGMLEGPTVTEITQATDELVFRVPTALVVTGRVLAPDATPIPGARVSNFGFGMGGGGTVADEEGRYELRVNTFGGMGGAMLMATAPGYVQPQASMMMTGKADASGVVRHDIPMERGAVVTGRVVDGEARPLAGALVAFRGGGPDAMMGMGAMLRPVTGYTAEDGSFLVDSVPAAKGATVTATRTGYVETASAPFDVVSGQSVRAPDLVMRRGATLVVRVSSPGGGPPKGGRVQVDLAEDRQGFDMMNMLRGDVDVPTDERGVARVANLKAGKATVTASARGFAPARLDVDVPADDGAEREVEVRLRAASPITGRVVDEAGQPIGEATVRVAGGGEGDAYVPPASATSGADGTFRIEGLPEVPVTMTVRAKGRVNQMLDDARRREDLEVRLTPENPDKAKRRGEVMGELTKIMGELQAAKDEAERKAIQQRMQELSMELGELGIEGMEGIEDIEVNESDIRDVRREEPKPPKAPGSDR